MGNSKGSESVELFMTLSEAERLLDYLDSVNKGVWPDGPVTQALRAALTKEN